MDDREQLLKNTKAIEKWIKDYMNEHKDIHNVCFKFNTERDTYTMIIWNRENEFEVSFRGSPRFARTFYLCSHYSYKTKYDDYIYGSCSGFQKQLTMHWKDIKEKIIANVNRQYEEHNVIMNFEV